MSKKRDFIDWRDDWRNCRAKKQLIEDFSNNFLPVDRDAMTPEAAHQLRPVYTEVEFKKFKRHFESLRKSVGREKARAFQDSEGLARDQLLHPIPAAQLDRTVTLELLRKDMQENKHNTLGAKELWLSRPEYHETFNLRSFRDQIYTQDKRVKRLANPRPRYS